LFFQLCAFAVCFGKTESLIKVLSKNFHSKFKIFQKSSLNNSLPLSFKAIYSNILQVKGFLIKKARFSGKIEGLKQLLESTGEASQPARTIIEIILDTKNFKLFKIIFNLVNVVVIYFNFFI